MSNSTGVWAGLSGNPLLVAAIGAFIGFALGVALTYGTFLGRRYLKALGKHKLLLIATLKRELPPDHLATYDGDRLLFPPLDWGLWDPPSIKVLEHLRDPSYAQISIGLLATQKQYSLHTAEKASGLTAFRAQIDEAVGKPAGMVQWNGTYPGPTPWYAISTIRKILFEDHRRRLGGGYFDPVDIKVERNPNAPSSALGHQLNFNRIQVAVGSEPDMAVLEERIRPLLDDEFLREYVRRIDAADKDRVSEPTKRDFDDARKAVLERLELKSEAVRGNCPLCPSFVGIHPVDESPA